MASEKIDALELDIDAKLNTENIDELIKKLEELGKSLDKLKGKSVKVNIQETGNASEKASSQVDKLTTSFLNQAVKITALIGIYRKLTGWISDGITSSMSYTENMNLFTVSLGEYSENAAKYGDTVREALGIDPSNWIRTQGVFNTLIEGFGVAGDQAAYMSQNLTQLTYDIASFYNLSISDAEKKIQSAVAGELEPVRRLGYDLSQNALTAIAQNPEYYGRTTYSVNELTGALEANNEALEDNTIRTVANFNELTQAEKVQLRYIALMTQVEEAQGDLSRTLNDPANQMRIFREELSMTSRALGNAFIPALNQVMPYVTAFFQVIEEGLQKIAAWFGYELPDMSDRIDVSDSVGAYDDIADDLGRAARNAKKIKDYTIGLDELNVLKPDDGISGGSGSSYSNYALGSIYKTPGYDFLGTAIENRIKEAKEQLDTLIQDFKEHPLQVSWEIVSGGVEELQKGIWAAIIGKTPEELAQEAYDNGTSVWHEFAVTALYDSAFSNVGDSIWRVLLGKTPDEMGEDAYNNGTTVGKEFLEGVMYSNNAATFLLTGGIGNIIAIIMGEAEESKIAKRAGEAGRTIGEQFMLEFANQIAKIFASNPLLQEVYKIATGRDVEADLAAIHKALYGTERKQSGWQSKPQNGNYQVRKDGLGNTSADEARKRGEEAAKNYAEGWTNYEKVVGDAGNSVYNSIWKGITNNGSANSLFKSAATSMASNYANGLLSGRSSAKSAGTQLYSSAYNGISSKSNDFTNIGKTLANAFTNALGSQQAKTNAYNAGWSVANTGSNGAYAPNGDYYWVGDQAGRGYVLGIKAHEWEAEASGWILARMTLNNLARALDINSPSKKAAEMGMFFDLGFANAIEDYAYTATNAADEMAKLSLRALDDSFISDRQISIPNSNAGYGIGAMNESAMATLASNIYQAVVSGLATYNGSENKDVKVIIDGKEVFTVVQTEARKRGATISNGAFSR